MEQTIENKLITTDQKQNQLIPSNQFSRVDEISHQNAVQTNSSLNQSQTNVNKQNGESLVQNLTNTNNQSPVEVQNVTNISQEPPKSTNIEKAKELIQQEQEWKQIQKQTKQQLRVVEQESKIILSTPQRQKIKEELQNQVQKQIQELQYIQDRKQRLFEQQIIIDQMKKVRVQEVEKIQQKVQKEIQILAQLQKKASESNKEQTVLRIQIIKQDLKVVQVMKQEAEILAEENDEIRKQRIEREIDILNEQQKFKEEKLRFLLNEQSIVQDLEKKNEQLKKIRQKEEQLYYQSKEKELIAAENKDQTINQDVIILSEVISERQKIRLQLEQEHNNKNNDQLQQELNRLSVEEYESKAIEHHVIELNKEKEQVLNEIESQIKKAAQQLIGNPVDPNIEAKFVSQEIKITEQLLPNLKQ